MAFDWYQLTALVGDARLVVERVRVVETGIAIEGEFEVPPLARLSAEDQVFVAAFVRSHGSIKQMEEAFGVSYPTIKNRLNRLAGQLEFVAPRQTAPPSEVLVRLEQGEITVEQAVAELKP